MVRRSSEAYAIPSHFTNDGIEGRIFFKAELLLGWGGGFPNTEPDTTKVNGIPSNPPFFFAILHPTVRRSVVEVKRLPSTELKQLEAQAIAVANTIAVIEIQRSPPFPSAAMNIEVPS